MHLHAPAPCRLPACHLAPIAPPQGNTGHSGNQAGLSEPGWGSWAEKQRGNQPPQTGGGLFAGVPPGGHPTEPRGPAGPQHPRTEGAVVKMVQVPYLLPGSKADEPQDLCKISIGDALHPKCDFSAAPVSGGLEQISCVFERK